MLYNIYFQNGYNTEKFKENDDPIEAGSPTEALDIFEQHIIDTFDPAFVLTDKYFAVKI